MQVGPSTNEIIIFIWFGLAIIIEIVGTIVLRLWLPRHGVRLLSSLTGVPGYMERAYLKWCRSQGRSGRGVLIFRAISLINVIIAAAFFIAITAR